MVAVYLKIFIIKCWGTSLGVQWLRIYFATQGTQVRSLVGELNPCAAFTEPLLWNLCATAREPVFHNKRSCMLELRPNTAN